MQPVRTQRPVAHSVRMPPSRQERRKAERAAAKRAPAQAGAAAAAAAAGQGLTLVHFSDYPETFPVTDTLKPPSVSHKMCLC